MSTPPQQVRRSDCRTCENCTTRWRPQKRARQTAVPQSSPANTGHSGGSFPSGCSSGGARSCCSGPPSG
eukprot:7126399-Alexandrium_andersonii.AAC.1